MEKIAKPRRMARTMAERARQRRAARARTKRTASWFFKVVMVSATLFFLMRGRYDAALISAAILGAGLVFLWALDNVTRSR